MEDTVYSSINHLLITDLRESLSLLIMSGHSYCYSKSWLFIVKYFLQVKICFNFEKIQQYLLKIRRTRNKTTFSV